MTVLCHDGLTPDHHVALARCPNELANNLNDGSQLRWGWARGCKPYLLLDDNKGCWINRICRLNVVLLQNWSPWGAWYISERVLGLGSKPRLMIDGIINCIVEFYGQIMYITLLRGKKPLLKISRLQLHDPNIIYQISSMLQRIYSQGAYMNSN